MERVEGKIALVAGADGDIGTPNGPVWGDRKRTELFEAKVIDLSSNRPIN